MQDPTTRSEQPAAARYPFPSGHESDVNDRFSDTCSSYGAQRTNQIIRALGWFSVGLGLMQLFVPRTVSRAAGTDQHPVLLRALGARELASVVGILSQHKTGNWLWSRVAGDVMDLALLGIAARSSGARRSRLGWAAAAVAGVAALDVISSVQRQRREQALDHFGGDVHVEKCITINRPMDDMEKGDILGHEFMGEVVALGSEVMNLKIGDRVVVPLPIACGHCFFCEEEMYSVCENSNPNAWMAEKMWGHSPAGIFGYSHLTGGYTGGQAEYARVPYADVGPVRIPDGMSDEQVLFLSDILPTGWMAAENCDIKPGHVVAVWGCGPAGQFAIQSAFLMGAERVIAIDRFPERLRMAREHSKAETLNYEAVDVADALKQMTGGRGPHACIDAVGLEAHGIGLTGVYDKVKSAMMLETDRPTALREALMACRNGGVVSVPGVYGGFLDKILFGSVMNRSLTIRTGQTHVQRYMRPLLERIQKGELDPSFVITHRLPLDDAPRGYEMFKKKQDECIKVILRP